MKKIMIILCILIAVYLVFAFVTMDMLWVLGDWMWRLLFVGICLFMAIVIIDE